MLNSPKVKVRVAPSPTGFLHIGTAQSALYNWLFAKKNGGDFYLRIEDTDKERSTNEFEQSIIGALKWLGLDWSGEIVRQSERGPSYRKYLENLISVKKAFYCYHTQEELEAERKDQEVKKEPPRHICNHKSNQQTNKRGIIRLDVSNSGTVSFEDLIRGHIEFKAELLGDFSIAKNLDEPLYNFAVVIDDIDMGISHVIRGEDHISNTPKQILIYQALGFDYPIFAHLPLILAPDRSKLSKRHGATAVVDYEKDYLSEALVNFLASLGFTFSKEILNREEMVKEFELSKVHKSGAVFDVKKLNWFNAQYIKKLSPAEFKKASGMSDIPDAAMPLITERLEKLTDAEGFAYLWSQPEYDKDLLNLKNTDPETTKSNLEKVKNIVEQWDFKSPETLRKNLDEAAGDKRGPIYWPFRVALSGKEKSPDPVDIATIIGKDEVVKRIQHAIGLI